MDTTSKILLVESNLFIGGILSQRLKGEGFAVVTATGGKDGAAKIREENPAVAFVDLPPNDVMIFLSVVRRLAQETHTTMPPIVVLSSMEKTDELRTLSEFGVRSYLVKAYTDIDEMVARIKEVLSHKELDTHTVVEDQERAKELLAPDINEQKHIKADVEKALSTPGDNLAIVKLIDHIIRYAYLAHSSDIHIKPEHDKVTVRMRIDGLLNDVFALPKEIHPEVITRIKVLAGMRTDEHQMAQDGRFRTNIRELAEQFDMRVSVVPTYFGEDAVMRLLVEQTSIKSIESIAFSDKDREKVMRAIEKPYGMILATGPTGSGKTTTLYTILKRLNTKDISIITIEDPIEYSLAGIDQIQVNVRTGLTFADGLRSVLRQDPDIIMVGEIRDKETAGIAVNAALTGHLMLSTLHTNDAATTLPRLLDMGAEPFLVASTVNIAIGQRLVRMICKRCIMKKRITDAEFKGLSDFLPHALLGVHRDFFYGKGCKQCSMSGYAGRLGIYEVLEMDEELRQLVMRRVDSDELKKAAIRKGMTTMLEDGFIKALQGMTTIEEILRVVRE